MCVVSMIGEHFGDQIRRTHPGIVEFVQTRPPQQDWNVLMQLGQNPVSRAEFESLKKTVDEMVALLRRAKIYDEEHHEPDCEIEEKMALLRNVAKFVGVDLDKMIAKEGATK